ncbi:MAG: carboxyl transferase domain-containing protein, partial [Frankiaceae bacterium]
MQDKIELLNERREKAEAGGGPAKHDKQHDQGKLTARERIAELVDPGSFQEIALFAEHRSTMFGMADADLPADGVVTGSGTVLGRVVHFASQDFSVAGGSTGEVHASKVASVLADSLKTGTPFIFINDSGGARVQEGIDSLSGYGKIFFQ